MKNQFSRTLFPIPVHSPKNNTGRPTKLAGTVQCLVAGLILILPLGSLAMGSCITADCHATMGTEQFVHDPVAGNECDACHAATGRNHPGETGAFELTEQGTALCLQCHDRPGEGKKYPHPPVEEDCTVCHNPHQGNLDKFLHKETGKLCLMCHEQIDTIITEAESQHEPVAEGECLQCHISHGSDFSPLLKVFYPRNTYTEYSDKKFALCLECQRKEVFRLKKTMSATNFRNGDQNLHFVHVNRQKGRVCVNCHGIHGADLPKLIHSTSPAFGAWNIPIDFIKTETGATCVTGCHKEKSYDREKKVVNR